MALIGAVDVIIPVGVIKVISLETVINVELEI